MADLETMLKTPLYNWHSTHGGKMVPFAGWAMPVQYSGLKEEHLAVRNAAGLFDVSHMGEIRIKGPHSLATVQHLTTNDASKLTAGQAQYSLLPNAQGGLIDDLIVYCVEPGSDYLLCVNASNKDKDFKHMIDHNLKADITDESSRWGQIALQGPNTFAILKELLGLSDTDLKPFHFKIISWNNLELWVARTGYTGEAGVEIFVPWNETEMLWTALLSAGQNKGLVPCGLGARDTLRTEVKYPLYGQEIDDVTNPYAAGLGWVIKPQAKDFVGKSPMVEQKPHLTQKLVGAVLEDKGIARQGYAVFSSENVEIGRVTSGTLSPLTQQAILVLYVDQKWSEVGTQVWVDIRGRKALAKIVPTPFVATKSKN